MTQEPSHTTVHDEASQFIAEASRRFEADWLKAPRRSLEEYLTEAPDAIRPALLHQLLAMEMRLLLNAGEPLPVDDYLRRFPDTELIDHVYHEVVNAASAGSATDAREGPLFQRIGDYRILREVGRGGMGIVYEAVQESLGRHVALKVLPPSLDQKTRRRARFELEARTIARLHHSNIVNIYGSGQDGGTPYIAMQYIDGRGLDAVLQDCRSGEGQLSADLKQRARQVARIGRQIAEALDYAHLRGVLHRDVKPSNILLDAFGTAWLTDFGVAKLMQAGARAVTEAGSLVGTLIYVPPEAFERETDSRGDIYSLGLTLYELLALRPAYDETTQTNLVHEVMHRGPPQLASLCPDVPRDLLTIVCKAIERDPAQRYKTAASLAEDLRRFLDDEPIEARPAGVMERTWRWCRRNPVVAALSLSTAALFAMATVGSIIAALWFDHARRRADDLTLAEKLAREEARGAAAEGRRRLVRLNIATGNNYVDAGDNWSGLLWYAQAWMDDRDDSRSEASHRQRLAAVLDRCPRLSGICFHVRPVLDAAWDGTARFLVTRTDEPQAYLWDSHTAERRAVMAHEQRVTHVAVSPDGQLIVSCSDDCTARLWNSTNGRPVGATRVHPAGVRWAAFDPAGERVATACADGKVRLWRVAGQEANALEITCAAEVQCVGFSPDGSHLVTVDRTDRARVWHVETGQPAGPPLPHHFTPGNPADRIELPPAFSPDGQRLITAHGGTATAWDVATSRQVHAFVSGGSAINSFSWSPDGQRMLIIPKGSAAVIIDAGDGREQLRYSHPREVQHGRFSPDGRRVFTSSSGGVIHHWDARTGKPLLIPFRNAGNLHRLACSQDGQRVLAAGADGTARIWEIGAQMALATPYDFACGHVDRIDFPTVDLEATIRALSPDGTLELRVRGEEATVSTRGMNAPQIATLMGSLPWQSARFSPDGLRVATMNETGAQVWEARSGRPVGPFLEVAQPCTDVRFDHRGTRLMTCGVDGGVSLWEIQSGRRLLGPLVGKELVDAAASAGESALQKDPSQIHAIGSYGLSPDGRWAAVVPSVNPGRVVICDLERGTRSHTTPIRGFVASVEFSADSRRIVFAGSDTVVRVLDVKTREPVGPPLRHPTFARCAGLSDDGRRVATGAADGKIRVWDLETGDLLMPATQAALGSVSRVWFSADGRRVVALTADRRLHQRQLSDFLTQRERVPFLVQLLTGHEIDATGGIVALDWDVIRTNAEPYRQAWRSWRGLPAQAGSPTQAPE